tara:strand:- start:193 stop:636 length:444 start_codon:yes stop_codon:yes gene_type:complete
MLAIEFEMVKKVLDWDLPEVLLLQKQVPFLRTKRRTKSDGLYTVEFYLPSQYSDLLIDHSNDFFCGKDIVDTVVVFNESTEWCWVTLRELGGYIQMLELSGDYDFRLAFSIKELHWVKTIFKENQVIEFELTKTRDAQSAIGYHPGY